MYIIGSPTTPEQEKKEEKEEADVKKEAKERLIRGTPTSTAPLASHTFAERCVVRVLVGVAGGAPTVITRSQTSPFWP